MLHSSHTLLNLVLTITHNLKCFKLHFQNSKLTKWQGIGDTKIFRYPWETIIFLALIVCKVNIAYVSIDSLVSYSNKPQSGFSLPQYSTFLKGTMFYSFQPMEKTVWRVMRLFVICWFEAFPIVMILLIRPSLQTMPYLVRYYVWWVLQVKEMRCLFILT